MTNRSAGVSIGYQGRMTGTNVVEMDPEQQARQHYQANIKRTVFY